MIAHEIAGIASRSKVPEKVLPVVNGFNKVPEEGSGADSSMRLAL
jgi:hypothetical protein